MNMLIKAIEHLASLSCAGSTWTMTAAKKFCVVKLYAPELRRSPYKVVPTFWIKNENNNVTVPYPPEKKLAQNFDRIYDCQLPLAEWEDYHGVIECETGKSLQNIWPEWIDCGSFFIMFADSGIQLFQIHTRLEYYT